MTAEAQQDALNDQIAEEVERAEAFALAQKDRLHNALTALLAQSSPEEMVEMLANVIFGAAAKSYARRDPEGHHLDRVAEYLDNMSEHFSNEDSSQEQPSYYAEGYTSARERLLKDSGQ